ncbi:hypothetical protein ACF3NG_11455 (plasmid) [Aerococcaceae bacterium WGS1372]
MGNCAFLELNDMGYALPPYQEIPVVVDMDEEHAQHYREIGHDIMSTMRSTPGLGGMNSISIFMNVMYQYADMPFNMSQVTAHDQSGVEHILGIPHNYDINEYTPQKVEQLIRTLKVKKSINMAVKTWCMSNTLGNRRSIRSIFICMKS